MPFIIRRSHIEDYLKCPFMTYNKIIKNVGSDGNIWTKVGNILHDIFEDVSLNKEKNILEDMIESYNSKFYSMIEENKKDIKEASSIMKGDPIESMLERGSRSCKYFYEYEKTAPNPLYTELTVLTNLRKDLPSISTTIDRINPTVSGGIEIVDYKSGKVYVGKKLENDLQVPLYILAISRHLNELPERFILMFTDEEKERIYERVDDDKYICRVRKKEYIVSLAETERRVIQILEKMQKGYWDIPQKPPMFFCDNFCEIRKLGLCAGGVDQKWSFKNM